METLLKLLIIGDSGVRKSCLLLRYADSIFSAEFLPTIGVDFKVRTLQIGEKAVKIRYCSGGALRAITRSYY